jgi:hypothetical protein
MLLDQGDDPGERQGVRLQPALTEDPGALQWHPVPEPLAGAHPEQGRRLDDARAEFRAAWQAQIAETRDQVESARRAEERYGSCRQWLFAGGAGFGAYFAMLAGLLTGSIFNAFLGLIAGAIAGWVAVVPLALLSVTGEQYFRAIAEQRERKLRELEQS